MTSDHSICELTHKLAHALISEGAHKKRSLTHQQLFSQIGFVDEHDMPGRDLMTSLLLPSIGQRCFDRGLPILSSLAVSDATLKPGEWFKALIRDLLGIACPEDPVAWRSFVDYEQEKALQYWGRPSRAWR
jgi:hypothetical protein